MKTDGSDNKKLCGSWTDALYAAGDRVYCHTTEGGETLYAMKIDGSVRRLVN